MKKQGNEMFRLLLPLVGFKMEEGGMSQEL